MISALCDSVYDALAVFVVLVDLEIHDVSDIDEFPVSFEISARFTHDGHVSVMDKIESAYAFYYGACHSVLFSSVLLFPVIRMENTALTPASTAAKVKNTVYGWFSVKIENTRTITR